MNHANISTPISLKRVYAAATFCASRLALMHDIIPVIEVPRFAPIKSGIDASKDISPCIDSVIIIPIKAALLWINAVKIVPAKMPNMGT